ncbi:MAG: IS6 family transposase, partial [Francisellaceae bacterium]|nr:IS6 family transposase [Francisellaceae bacterium]
MQDEELKNQINKWQSQWFQYFDPARKTISGYETMHMLRKGQVKNLAKGDAIA